MSIIYALIAREYDKVLCEYTDYHGNFEQITRSLMKRTRTHSKATIEYDESYIFHYITENNTTYMIMCEITYPYENAFEFLAVIKENFEKTYTREAIESAYAYAFNKDFGQILQQKINFYNTHVDSTITNQIDRFRNGQISPNETLLKADDLLGGHNDKMSLIVKRFDIPDSSTNSFFEGAQRVKDRMKWKKIIRYVTLFLISFLAAYIISMVICGGPSLSGCFGSKTEEEPEAGA